MVLGSRCGKYVIEITTYGLWAKLGLTVLLGESLVQWRRAPSVTTTAWWAIMSSDPASCVGIPG